MNTGVMYSRSPLILDPCQAQRWLDLVRGDGPELGPSLICTVRKGKELLAICMRRAASALVLVCLLVVLAPAEPNGRTREMTVGVEALSTQRWRPPVHVCRRRISRLRERRVAQHRERGSAGRLRQSEGRRRRRSRRRSSCRSTVPTRPLWPRRTVRWTGRGSAS